MEESPVLIKKHDGGVAVVTLNRPKSMNSWTPDMSSAYFETLDDLDADPEVRVIVLTGAGRAFCAGADMGGLNAESSGKKGVWESKKKPEKEKAPPLITHASSLTKPVIAAINGPAAGIGLALACSCDFRFCASDAKLTSAFSKLGLIAEHGLSWALPHLVGTGNAMRMLMTSDVVTGEEARQMGLVQRCFDKEEVLEETIAYAQNLAATVPSTNLAIIKQQVLRHPLMDKDEAMHSSNRLMYFSTRYNPDYQEGVKAFMSKKPAKWAPFDSNSKMVEAAKKEFPLAKL